MHYDISYKSERRVMIEAIEKLMNSLPPIHSRKNPSLALIIGFVAGGVGLAIYFRSLVDLILPVGIGVACALLFGDYGIFGGAILASLYGFFRASSSNKNLGT
jgi:hypothetical protein